MQGGEEGLGGWCCGVGIGGDVKVWRRTEQGQVRDWIGKSVRPDLNWVDGWWVVSGEWGVACLGHSALLCSALSWAL